MKYLPLVNALSLALIWFIAGWAYGVSHVVSFTVLLVGLINLFAAKDFG